MHTPHIKQTSHTSCLKVFVRKLIHVLILPCLLFSSFLLPPLSFLPLVYTMLFLTAGEACALEDLTSAWYMHSEETYKTGRLSTSSPTNSCKRRHSDSTTNQLPLSHKITRRRCVPHPAPPHLGTLGIQKMVRLRNNTVSLYPILHLI